MRNEKFVVTFVCTGNTCRSPMAEGMFKAELPENLKDKIFVQSRGLAANPNDNVSQNSVTAMRDYGIDISSHKATPFNKKDLLDTDLFVCMTISHAEALLRCGTDAEKIMVLNVSDPFGGSVNDYRKCAEEIKSKLGDVYELVAQSI